jgi:hypothetical protein
LCVELRKRLDEDVDNFRMMAERLYHDREDVTAIYRRAGFARRVGRSPTYLMRDPVFNYVILNNRY